MLLVVSLAFAADPPAPAAPAAAPAPAASPAKPAPISYADDPTVITAPVPHPEVEILLPRLDVSGSVNADIDRQVEAGLLRDQPKP
jgi:hypothetical protein